ncbi:MAG: L17 family ribosomal protein [Clostridia bacterium]|nr:L17 family ribosomal protein [Clostridia bacterium]MDD4375954.1 L17 family ribosomal protein [Clostridia bacterium]
MAKITRLSRTTSQRDALLKGLVTSLIENGKVKTTLAKAKAIKPIADSIVSLAVKEKDNVVEKEKTISSAKLDKNGKKVKIEKTSKNGKKYQVIDREIKKVTVKVDAPSRLIARRKMFKYINKIQDNNGNTIDLTDKLFNEIATKYEGDQGGYTRITKLVARKGDGAEMAVIELI